MIIFAGGQITSRGDPAAAPLNVSDVDDRSAGWRDFREGLTQPEQALFLAPNGRGELQLSAAGRAAMHGRASRNVHLHVLQLGRAAESPARRLFVMPMPVTRSCRRHYSGSQRSRWGRMGIAASGLRSTATASSRWSGLTCARRWAARIARAGRSHPMPASTVRASRVKRSIPGSRRSGNGCGYAESSPAFAPATPRSDSSIAKTR